LEADSVIKVLFFGMLRDIAEMREEACELPAMATLGGVFDAYATRFPRLRELRRSIVLARNQRKLLRTDAGSNRNGSTGFPNAAG
jgi:molybdopterin converting factor small subunit